MHVRSCAIERMEYCRKYCSVSFVVYLTTQLHSLKCPSMNSFFRVTGSLVQVLSGGRSQWFRVTPSGESLPRKFTTASRRTAWRPPLSAVATTTTTRPSRRQPPSPSPPPPPSSVVAKLTGVRALPRNRKNGIMSKIEVSFVVYLLLHNCIR